MTTYHTAFRAAQIETVIAAAPSPDVWGPTTDAQHALECDAAVAYEGAGCDMPDGGLTEQQEWALDLAGWAAL